MFQIERDQTFSLKGLIPNINVRNQIVVVTTDFDEDYELKLKDKPIRVIPAKKVISSGFIRADNDQFLLSTLAYHAIHPNIRTYVKNKDIRFREVSDDDIVQVLDSVCQDYMTMALMSQWWGWSYYERRTFIEFIIENFDYEEADFFESLYRLSKIVEQTLGRVPGNHFSALRTLVTALMAERRIPIAKSFANNFVECWKYILDYDGDRFDKIDIFLMLPVTEWYGYGYFNGIFNDKTTTSVIKEKFLPDDLIKLRSLLKNLNYNIPKWLE